MTFTSVLEAWSSTEQGAPTAHACCSGNFYGAATSTVDDATNAIWPQLSGPYCGIATIMAIANYADDENRITKTFSSRAAQQVVASNNSNSAAVSMWGYVSPPPGNNVAGKSNISGDYGTDPRSIAYMAWEYTPFGFFYHDYIYRWQFAHSSAPSYAQQVLEAATIMGAQLENYGEPLSVAINEGLHSILVTGVYSNNEPLAFFPAAITGVTYRDPQDGSHVTVDISTWTWGISGGYDLWKHFYGYNNTQDPEPSIGIYKPSTGQEHWFGGFNWISHDSNGNGTDYLPDWSYTAYPGLKMTTP